MVSSNRRIGPVVLGGLLYALIALSVIFVGAANAQPAGSIGTALPTPAEVGAFASSPPVTSTPSTTFAPLGHLPITPSTEPLITKAQSGHVSDVFVALSLAGFAMAAVLVIAQLCLTRRARRRRGARTL